MRLGHPAISATLVLACVEAAGAADWARDEVHSSCIPIEPSDLDVERHCTVAKFDEAVTIGTGSLYYALYRDFLPDRGQPAADDQYNVLVLFFGRADSGRVDVLRVRQNMRSWSVSYEAPETLGSDWGTLLYLPGWGIGDGRSQYSYDEYWLWKDVMWQQLDVWSWSYSRLSEFLPAGLSLDGISKSDFDLPSMRYSGKVRRSDDCHTCATGGSVTIEFQWDDLVLGVERVEYFPDTR
jgi:hypothetical protein